MAVSVKYSAYTMRGFTLLEMIVVLAIISILTGIAVTTLRFDRKEHNLTDVSMEIVELYRSARDEALLSGSLRRIIFKSNELNVEKRSSIGSSEYIQDDNMQKINLGSLIESALLTPQAPIYFYPNGQTSSFHLTLSVLSAENNISRIISADAMGRISVTSP